MGPECIPESQTQTPAKFYVVRLNLTSIFCQNRKIHSGYPPVLISIFLQLKTDLLKTSGRKEGDIHAAVWIPDEKVTKCMNCQVTEFSLINRRHHCRNCGNVVCHNCSSRKRVIPSGKSQDKPVRVCDKCFDKLEVSQPPETVEECTDESISSIEDYDSDDDYESADENE